MSTPAVIMPNAEKVLVAFFEAAFAELDGFDDLEVWSRIPDPRPDRWLLVRRVGGGRRDQICDNPMMAIEAWSGSKAEPRPSDAHDVCQTALALLHGARGQAIAGTTLSRIEDVAGPANLPDPTSEQPRYTTTVSVVLRGTAL